MIRFKATSPDGKTIEAKPPKVAAPPPPDDEDAPEEDALPFGKARSGAKAKKGGMQRKKPMGR